MIETREETLGLKVINSRLEGNKEENLGLRVIKKSGSRHESNKTERRDSRLKSNAH